MAKAETKPSRRDGGIQVIARSADILRELTDHSAGLSLSQISAGVGLPRSTVHRIVTALAHEGLVAVASPSGRYRLGPEILRLAEAKRGDLRTVVRPFIESLSSELNETVDVSVLVRDSVYFIDQIAAPHRLRAVSAIGESFPAFSNAPGKALLAQQSNEQLERILPEQLPTLTENSIATRDALIRELETIRADGIAYDREEHTEGICAIGVAVSDGRAAVAAISVPMPRTRFEPAEAKLAAILPGAGREISAALERGI